MAGIIDISRIESMVAQLKAAAANATGKVSSPLQTQAEQPAERVDFSAVLKASLDQINNVQQKAQVMGERFASGDDNVNLSDMMISMQKANINFQATVQVRNKLVSAYQDIMNMQV